MISSSGEETRLKNLLNKHPALGEIVRISSLAGGLTNRNYVLDAERGRFVARVGSASSVLLGIDREREKINTGQAHASGIGPEVIDSIPEENLLILRWVEARTLHAEDFREDQRLLVRAAETLRHLHDGKPFEGVFHFPTLRKKYLDAVRSSGYYLPDEYLTLESKISALERLLGKSLEPLVPCNNDLLAENFLDDGQKIWIIDYEYSGQNEASFDIGNMCGELGMPLEQLTLFCNTYWRQHLPEKITRARAWSMIARFGWVLWASIQQAVSPIDFDFRSWGMKKWASVAPELTGDAYSQLLTDLKTYYA